MPTGITLQLLYPLHFIGTVVPFYALPVQVVSFIPGSPSTFGFLHSFRPASRQQSTLYVPEQDSMTVGA